VKEGQQTSSQVAPAPVQSGPPVHSGVVRLRREVSVDPIRKRILFQVLVCTLIPCAFMGLGEFSYAGQSFWGSGPLHARGHDVGQASEILCVVVALFPLINQLRGIGIFYSIVRWYSLWCWLTLPMSTGAGVSAPVRSNGLWHPSLCSRLCTISQATLP